MTTQTRVNGLDTGKLQEVVAALQADPSQTQTNWRTSVHWDTGFQNQFTARDHRDRLRTFKINVIDTAGPAPPPAIRPSRRQPERRIRSNVSA